MPSGIMSGLFHKALNLWLGEFSWKWSIACWLLNCILALLWICGLVNSHWQSESRIWLYSWLSKQPVAWLAIGMDCDYNFNDAINCKLQSSYLGWNQKRFHLRIKVLQQLWCSDCSCVNCWSMICYWCDLKFSMNIESYYFQLVCVSVTCCWYECEMVYLISDVTWFANDIIYFLYLKKMSACVQLGIA